MQLTDKEKRWYYLLDVLTVLGAVIIFIVPFYFMLLQSLKNSREAGLMNLRFPSDGFHFENFIKVIQAQKYMILRAFFNSVIITAGSIVTLVIICSMGGYILQRVGGRFTAGINFIILTGLMLPPAILPTIWVMSALGIYRTMFGMIIVEVALHIPFCTMLYRGYISSLPRELEEAAYVDGCTSWYMFVRIIFPLLMPVTATITALQSVGIFNDFVNPLYFLPGSKNPTVQLTLYNFMSQYESSWNLLFADVILITIPPLILFIFFNQRIVSGITAGAVKA
ncbi:MAG: carbohydrate ABC transporter permease [Spirochaetaceae bacterium]|jgi:raffinose/stachyose/melibiose transport system permease protein|nr:carbohydrate ABC transporter permease [Spirochaetaceae bacterium]